MLCMLTYSTKPHTHTHITKQNLKIPSILVGSWLDFHFWGKLKKRTNIKAITLSFPKQIHFNHSLRLDSSHRSHCHNSHLGDSPSWSAETRMGFWGWWIRVRPTHVSVYLYHHYKYIYIIIYICTYIYVHVYEIYIYIHVLSLISV